MGIACLWFKYLNEYVDGEYCLIDENGNIISNQGYEDINGVVEVGDTIFWLLSSHNRFNPDSPFYKKTIFVLNNKGEVVLKGEAGQKGIKDESVFNDVLTYKGHNVLLDSEGNIIYTAPEDKAILYGSNYHGIVPFYYVDGSIEESERIYGYVNMKDEVVVEPQFTAAFSFSKEGLARVRTKDGKYGYLGVDGEFAIPPMYMAASDFSDGVATVTTMDSDEEINIDTEGNIMPFKGRVTFCEGYASVKGENEKYAYMDKNGYFLTDYIYDYAGDFYDGYAVVIIDEQYKVINTDGEVILDPGLLQIGPFINGGMACATADDELWGYININGEWIIEPKYSYVTNFINGSARVMIEK